MNEFNNELIFIKNEDIKKFLRDAFLKIPEYFWTMSASTTNRYHPNYALGDGGLVRHTKAAALIAYNLLNLEMYQKIYSERQRDLIIAAIILHDSHKKGLDNNKYTAFEHPIVAANFVRGLTGLSDEDKEYIASGIESHMGSWNKDTKTGKELPKPTTPHQKFIHICDYLASRKFLEVNFENVIDKEKAESYILTFGKYKGETVKEIEKKDRSYLAFLVSETSTLNQTHPSRSFITYYLEATK